MKARLSIVVAVATAVSPVAIFAQNTVYQSASDKHGVVHTTQVLKSGKNLETVKCSDFGLLEESFKPQAVTYAANYGSNGRPHDPVLTVSGTESIVPAVVADCKAHPGESLVTRVHAALAKK